MKSSNLKHISGVINMQSKTLSLIFIALSFLLAISCGGGGASSPNSISTSQITNIESTEVSSESKLGTLSGQASYGNQKGELTNLRVNVSGQGLNKTVFTDSTGSYALQLEEGDYDIVIEGSHIEPQSNRAKVTRNAVKEVNFILTATGDISGEVTIDSFDIDYDPSDFAVGEYFVQLPIISIMGTQFFGETDEKGFFQFSNIPVGSYALRMYYQGNTYYKEIVISQGENDLGINDITSFNDFYLEAEITSSAFAVTSESPYTTASRLEVDYIINENNSVSNYGYDPNSAYLYPNVTKKTPGVGTKGDENGRMISIAFSLSSQIDESTLATGFKILDPNSEEISYNAYGNSYKLIITFPENYTISSGEYIIEFTGLKDLDGALIANGTQYRVNFINQITEWFFDSNKNLAVVKFAPALDFSTLVISSTPELNNLKKVLREDGYCVEIKGDYQIGTSYQISINAAKADNGIDFDGLPYTMNVHRAATSIDYSPANNATGVSLDQVVNLEFYGSINRRTVSSSLTIYETLPNSTETMIPSANIGLQWMDTGNSYYNPYNSNNYYKVLNAASSSFSQGSHFGESSELNISFNKNVNSIYRIVLTTSKDLDGNDVSGFDFSFKTYEPALINIEDPSQGSNSNEIAILHFNDDVDISSLEASELVLTENGTAITFDLDYHDGYLNRVSVSPASGLNRNSDYNLSTASTSNINTLNAYSIDLFIDFNYQTLDQEVIYHNPMPNATDVIADQSNSAVTNYATLHFLYTPSQYEKDFIESNLILSGYNGGSDVVHPTHRFIWDDKRLYIDFTLDIDTHYIISFPNNKIFSTDEDSFYFAPYQFSTESEGNNSSSSNPYLINFEPSINRDEVTASDMFYFQLTGVLIPGSETFEMTLDGATVNFKDYFKVDHYITRHDYHSGYPDYNYTRSWTTIVHLDPTNLPSDKQITITLKDPVFATTRDIAKNVIQDDYNSQFIYGVYDIENQYSYTMNFDENQNYSDSFYYAEIESRTSYPVKLLFSTQPFRLVFDIEDETDDSIGSTTIVNISLNLGGQLKLSELQSSLSFAPHSINWITTTTDSGTSYDLEVAPSVYSHLEITPSSSPSISAYDSAGNILGAIHLDNKAVLTIQPDLIPLELSYVTTSANYIDIFFNQYVDKTTIETLSNYSLSGTGITATVTSIQSIENEELSTDKPFTAVRAYLSTNILTTETITLTLSGIKSLGGIQTILASNATYTFPGHSGALVAVAQEGSYNNGNYVFKSVFHFDTAINTDSHSFIDIFNDTNINNNNYLPITDISHEYINNNHTLIVHSTDSNGYRTYKVNSGITNATDNREVQRKTSSTGYSYDNDIRFSINDIRIQSTYTANIRLQKYTSNEDQLFGRDLSVASNYTVTLSGNTFPVSNVVYTNNNSYIYLTLSSNINTSELSSSTPLEVSVPGSYRSYYYERDYNNYAPQFDDMYAEIMLNALGIETKYSLTYPYTY